MTPPAAPVRADVTPTRRPLTRDELDRRASEVQDWHAAIRAQLGEKAREERLAQWKLCREGLAGWLTYAKDGAQQKVKARRNFVAAQEETLLPFVYSRSPQVGVRPRPPLRIPGLPTTDRTPEDWHLCLPLVIELVLARFLEQAGSTDKGKDAVRSSLTTGLGLVMASVQDDGRENVSRLLGRANDSRDNLARVDFALAQLDQAEGQAPAFTAATLADAADAGDRAPRPVTEPGAASPLSPPPLPQSREGLDRLKTEIEHQITALHAEAESARQPRLVLTPLLPEDWLVSPNVTRLKDHLDADWQAFKTVMPRKRYEARFGPLPANTTLHGAAPNETVAVWSIWDRATGVVHWLAEGAADYACDSEAPQPATSRFYPVHLLAWRWGGDTDRWPFGAIEDWLPIVEEIDEKVQRERDTTRAIKIGVIANGQALPPDQVAKIQKAGDLEITVLNGSGEFPMDRSFMPYPNPTFPMELFDLSRLQAHLDQISGVAEFLRGGGLRDKTATEASYMQEGLASRLSERLAAIETLFTDIGRHATEMLLQTLTKDDVGEIAGDLGRLYWPETLSLKQLHEVALFKVQAGASQNPSKTEERKTLTEVLPILGGLMDKALLLTSQGNVVMAQSVRKLAAEVLRRFDEGLDIDDIWPKEAMAPPAPPLPGLPGGLPTPGDPAAPDMPPPVNAGAAVPVAAPVAA